jgi:hypothetical protein
MANRKRSNWAWLISILALIAFLDLIALTWHFWAMPADLFNEKKKILTTVASWAGSILTFLGIRYKFKKGQSIEQVLAIRPVQLCVIAFTFVVWFFVVPFHSLSLVVTDLESGRALSGVTVKVDEDEFPRPALSDPMGEIRIGGVRAAPHKLRLERPGYKTTEITASFIEVIGPLHGKSAVCMEEATGLAEIRSDPEGAEIYVDGEEKPRGTTNKHLSLKTGKHTVLLKKNQYYPTVWEEITISGTHNPRFEKKLIPILPPQTYNLVVQSYPANAEIWVDDVLRARTKASLTLTRGQHKIRISKENYRPEEYNVTIPHGEPISCILHHEGG